MTAAFDKLEAQMRAGETIAATLMEATTALAALRDQVTATAREIKAAGDLERAVGFLVKRAHFNDRQIANALGIDVDLVRDARTWVGS